MSSSGSIGSREPGHRISLHECPAERLEPGDGIDEVLGHFRDERVVVLDGAANLGLVGELDHPGRCEHAHVVGHRAERLVRHGSLELRGADGPAVGGHRVEDPVTDEMWAQRLAPPLLLHLGDHASGQVSGTQR